MFEKRLIRLEKGGAFHAFTPLAIPFEQRTDRTTYINAADETFIEQAFADSPSCLGIGKGAIDQRAHAFRPRLCAPQAKAATSKAPTSWWSTARWNSTPLITVAMPSRI